MQKITECGILPNILMAIVWGKKRMRLVGVLAYIGEIKNT